MCAYINTKQPLALSKSLRFLDRFQADDTRLHFINQEEINDVLGIWENSLWFEVQKTGCSVLSEMSNI